MTSGQESQETPQPEYTVSGKYNRDAAGDSGEGPPRVPLLPWSYPSTRKHGKTAKIEGTACW